MSTCCSNNLPAEPNYSPNCSTSKEVLNKRKKRQSSNSNNPSGRRSKTMHPNATKQPEIYSSNQSSANEFLNDYFNELKSSEHFHDYQQRQTAPKYYQVEQARKSFYSTSTKHATNNQLDSTCSSMHSSSPSTSSINSSNNNLINSSNNSPFYSGHNDGLYLLAAAAVSELEKCNERPTAAATTSMTY